jgi:transcriptional regulator with XRE-family HTH domain
MKNKDLGLKIKTLRKQKRIEIKDLAVKVDISSSYMSNIESGLRNPSLKTLEKIAKALEIPANVLLSEEITGRNLTDIYNEQKEKRTNLINAIKSELSSLEIRDLELVDSLIKAMIVRDLNK